MELEIIIVSHKRAGRVLTHKYIARAKICVPESQQAEYVKHHPADALLVHPDAVIGLPAKRQWIIENVQNVFMIDDDSMGMQRIWRPQGRKGIAALMKPDEARSAIEQCAATARELGAYMFGFNSHCAPMTYNGFRPFRFGGYTPGGAFGILEGSKLWFPNNTTLPIDDYWICLLNAYLHRYAWYDCRFAFAFKDTYIGRGGMAEYRADDAEAKATEYLKRYFGEAIQPKTVNRNKNRQTTKTERNRSARTMVVPWPH